MSLAPIIMYAVAAVLTLSGIASIVAIRGTSEPAIYARRLLATMLFALGGILGFFAWSMASWGGAK